jgi:DNA-binding LytR/AlgR family response regulator
VNLDHVREVRPISHGDGVVVLRDGTKVKLSRSRRADFEAVLKGSDPASTS